MARIYKQRVIGHGGEPSEYSIIIGNRDLPMIQKDVGKWTSGQGRVERVLCSTTDGRTANLLKIERLRLYDKSGKKDGLIGPLSLTAIKQWEIPPDELEKIPNAKYYQPTPIIAMLGIACNKALKKK